jgi:hypothetical protein
LNLSKLNKINRVTKQSKLIEFDSARYFLLGQLEQDQNIC